MGDFNRFYFPLVFVTSVFTISYILGNCATLCLIITHICVYLCFPFKIANLNNYSQISISWPNVYKLEVHM